jgi:hypothetical protein
MFPKKKNDNNGLGTNGGMDGYVSVGDCTFISGRKPFCFQWGKVASLARNNNT